MDALVYGLIGLIVGALLVGFYFLLKVKTHNQEIEALRTAREQLNIEVAKLTERDNLHSATELEKQEAESKADELFQILSERDQTIARFETELAERERSIREQKELLEDAEKKFTDTFEALSQRALKMSNEMFMQQSEQVLKNYTDKAENTLTEKEKAFKNMLDPMVERLKELENVSNELEKKRVGDYSALTEQLKALGEQSTALQTETYKLSRALTDSSQAGSWGETNLDRVLELSGLEKGIHYTLQESENSDDGLKRPDARVYISKSQQIIIDAKTPMSSYLAGLADGLSEAEKGKHMSDHASKLLQHAKTLRSRKYEQIEGAVGLVVMYIPSEGAYRAAVSARETIFEEILELQIHVCTPQTLLGLLRSVGSVWAQNKLAESAMEVRKVAGELLDSLRTYIDHMQKVGRNLHTATKSYNDAVGSFTSRVLPRARKIQELGVHSTHAIEDIESVEFEPRPLPTTQALVEDDALTLPQAQPKVQTLFPE